MGYRYIGSKEKLATTIIDYINDDCPHAHSVIDLMAGTGLMSLALRNRGYCVKASDVMTYSYHHLKVNLLLNMAPAFEGLNDLPLINPIAAEKYPNSNYERALALVNYWKNNGIYFNSEQCEIIISGSGQEGTLRMQPDVAGNVKNQRFLIHILPKPGVIN